MKQDIIKNIEKQMSENQYKDYLVFKKSSTEVNDEIYNLIKEDIDKDIDKDKYEDDPHILCVSKGERRVDILYGRVLNEDTIKKYSLNTKIDLFIKSVNLEKI